MPCNICAQQTLFKLQPISPTSCKRHVDQLSFAEQHQHCIFAYMSRICIVILTGYIPHVLVMAPDSVGKSCPEPLSLAVAGQLIKSRPQGFWATLHHLTLYKPTQPNTTIFQFCAIGVCAYRSTCISQF